MMGFGSYGNGGSSSASSSLSALAPPFTVDRSLPKPISSPLVDLTDPPYAIPLNSSLHNWLNSHSPNSRPDCFSEFDSVPSSNTYRYPGPQTFSSSNAHMPPLNPIATPSTDSFLYAQSSSGITNNLVEAKPYYPSYISPTIHNGDQHHQPSYDLLSTSHVATLNGSSQNDCPKSLSNLEHPTRWGGLWEGLADWEQGKWVELGGSFCPKDINVAGLSIDKDLMNQGSHTSKGLRTFEEAANGSDMLGRENHVGSTSTELLDCEPFIGKNPMFMPVDYSKTSILGSTSVLPEIYPQAPSPNSFNSWNHQMTYIVSNEKSLRQHDITSNDSMSVKKSSSSLVIRPPVFGTDSSALNKDSLKNVNPGSDAADMDFAGNNPYNVREPRPLLTSEGKLCFNPSQLSFHLDESNRIFVESSSIKSEELSGNKSVSKDTLDHLCREKSELQVPGIGLDGFNLAVDSNEAVNPVENSSESIDHYNPAVDSPCWKGALGSHFSPFEASEAVTSQLMKKLEAFNGSNLQGHQNFPLDTDDTVKVFSQKPSENSIYRENGLAPSPKRPSAANLLFREFGSDGSVETKSCHTKPSRGHGLQCADDINEPRKEYALPNMSIDESNFKISHTLQQSLKEGKLTYEKRCASGTGGADVGLNINDGSDGGSAYVPFYAAERVLGSPSSVEDDLTKLTKSSGGESAREMYIQTLVNTMHNLSELLLFHCSNDACDLKEKGRKAIKKVIDNLDKCMLKNDEQTTPAQDSVFPQQMISQILGESFELHKGLTVGRPQVSNVAAVEVEDQLDNQHMLREKQHCIVPCEKDEKYSHFVSVRGDADRVKHNNMTQAIKKVLSENFNKEEETQAQILLYKNLWLEAEAALCSTNYVARFNRMKIDMEKCKFDNAKENTTTDVEKLSERSRSMLTPDLNMVKKLEPEAKSGPIPDHAIVDPFIISTSCHADDVIARFQALKCRLDNSNHINALDVEKLSSPKASPDLNGVEELAYEGKSNPTTEISIMNSSVPSTTSHADDVEASVMARFCILKSRADNLSSLDMVCQELPEVEQKDQSIINDRSEDGILDFNMEQVLPQCAANCTQDKLIVKEFHVHDKNDPMIQSSEVNRFGNQPWAGWYDSSSSSEWEHVSKEEVVEQNVEAGVGSGTLLKGECRVTIAQHV